MSQHAPNNSAAMISTPLPHSSALHKHSIDAPNSSAHWYDKDVEFFSTTKMRGRKTFIRVGHIGEFESFPTGVPLPPPLWVQVIRIGAWHYRLPFWCGPQPFLTLPSSDDAVAAIVVERQTSGGYDVTALDNWQRNWSAYQSGTRP